MTEHEFNEVTLPSAVRWLFEANGYLVEGPIHHHGAEIDLVATDTRGLRNLNIYIEVTIEYVDNTKLGKDLTKLQMFAIEPNAQRLIVSSRGFTNPVRERAKSLDVMTMTYDELFASFEKLEPYVREITGNSERARELAWLNSIYQEPTFVDQTGRELATTWLDDWLVQSSDDAPWLVVVGEYGTGKTALSQILQYRWVTRFKYGDGIAIPFRVELRDFTRQFDARGLLHHFLDTNGLEHLSVRFVESMISQGRVILLLDGYDEMAQFLNLRERRACLEALSQLAGGGARGILTSRPNYFSEAEELRVFEVLYKRLEETKRLTPLDARALKEEVHVDEALERFFLHRIERQS